MLCSTSAQHAAQLLHNSRVWLSQAANPSGNTCQGAPCSSYAMAMSAKEVNVNVWQPPVASNNTNSRPRLHDHTLSTAGQLLYRHMTSMPLSYTGTLQHQAVCAVWLAGCWALSPGMCAMLSQASAQTTAGASLQ